MRSHNKDAHKGASAERRPTYPGEIRERVASRATNKWVKVAMAIAYFFSISLAALILVIYYGVFWSPNNRNNSTAVNLTSSQLCPTKQS